MSVFFLNNKFLHDGSFSLPFFFFRTFFIAAHSRNHTRYCVHFLTRFFYYNFKNSEFSRPTILTLFALLITMRLYCSVCSNVDQNSGNTVFSQNHVCQYILTYAMGFLGYLHVCSIFWYTSGTKFEFWRGVLSWYIGFIIIHIGNCVVFLTFNTILL